MPACLSCRTLVDTNVLLYDVCFAALCRTIWRLFFCAWGTYFEVDTRTVAIGACFVPSWCVQKKSRFKNKNFVVVCVLRGPYIWLEELMIQLALTAVTLQEEHLPSCHVHFAVGTPQCHHLDWKERLLCLELATLTQKHVRTVLSEVYDLFQLFCVLSSTVFFLFSSWGNLPLQSYWSLSCDHGLHCSHELMWEQQQQLPALLSLCCPCIVVGYCGAAP